MAEHPKYDENYVLNKIKEIETLKKIVDKLAIKLEKGETEIIDLR